MKRTLLLAALCALCFAARADKKTKAEAVTLAPSELKWGPAPAAFPKGAQVAVLHGDPFKKNLYALRLKMPDGYRIAPHWHTQDEELTIVSGTFQLAMGDSEAQPHALETGAYHFLPGKMHHSATAKGDVVVEVHGMGPFDIHYVNAADDPSKKAEAAK